MGGGLMQLVAYGAQDVYLTGNPQITFFKVVYRRHTNFAVEAILQTVNGSGAQRTVTVARNGDLLGRVYLVGTDSTSVLTWSVVSNVRVEIGGQKIDEQSGAWMQIYAGLTHNSDKKAMLDAMCPATAAGTNTNVYLPLQFWFCRNTGLALPLIALQYHEVKLQVSLASNAGLAMEVWCDYIYLDTDERRRFAQTSHEYLIEQVQHRSFAASSGNVINELLTFNHPVKELVWSLATGFTGTGALILNGHERFATRPADYFKVVQKYQHHSGNPTTLANVGCYSFALKPEEHQPSGTCNFSRIDNAELRLTGAEGALDVYAINYNVLRIMSGMGGLAYSN